MREELLERILFSLQEEGCCNEKIRDRMVIVLNDYEIAKRKTEVAVKDEDKNMNYIKRFLVAKTVAGCTDRTIKTYGLMLKFILDTIGKSVDEITTNDIRYYMAVRIRRDGITKNTLDNERRYLNTFYNYLMREELIMKNPMVKIEKVRQPKIQRPAFTEKNVEKIRGACKNWRETAIVEVMLSTGCRVSELVGIRLSDISQNSLIVHGKGEKDRKVYLNAKAELAIEKYIQEREDRNPYLFPAGMKMEFVKKSSNPRLRVKGDWYRYKENVAEDGHIDTGTVEQNVRRIGKRAGVEGAHPHRFRRTCATFALRRGMPLEQVSKMLGHEQLNTTQRYLDLSEKDLEQAHRKYVI